MSFYSQRVRANILPLSVGSTLPEAFEEWSFTENMVDHGHADQTCELCEQEDLRYHFQIQNALTAKKLMVGSSCILRFGVSVFEDGARLSAADAKRKLDRLVRQMHLDACVSALKKVAAAENNSILANALTFFQKNKYLTPKQAFVVLWRLRKQRIEHNPSFFKINLKMQRYKDDLRDMELSRVHAIWPALTSSQREMALRLGHSSPT